MTIIPIVAIYFFIYCFYQIIRNTKIFIIRGKWIETSDKRWHEYSYNYMFIPSIHNYFGLKYPNDKDFS